jgi:hypothetical protein
MLAAKEPPQNRFKTNRKKSNNFLVRLARDISKQPSIVNENCVA